MLEAEKGTAAFEAYEFKGDEKEFPAFLIREVRSGKVLTRVRWDGDANSDAQPLSLVSTVSWNPAGTAVILNTSERFYSHSGIWAFDQKFGGFKKLVLPDYKTMTGYEAPGSDELRPRGHGSTSWTKDGNLVYELTLEPLHPKDGGDSFRHKITFKFGAGGLEVLKREELKD